MQFGLSETQKMLVGTVRRFVFGELRPLEDGVEKHGVLDPAVASAIFERSRALGLYATNMPEEIGGGGLSAVDTMLVEEQFGHTTDILIRRAFGNVYEILLRCDEVQKDRWLVPTVAGERTCSLAFTEPDAGSDLGSITSRATKTGDDWRLNGSKHFVSDGEYSDFFVVSAVTDAQAGRHGISVFLVDKNVPGVSIGRDQPMMGLRGTSHVELFFDNAVLGPETLLGEEGGGMHLMTATLGRVRLAQIGARAIGKATRLLDLASEYARQRRQFKKPIGDFQMVQRMLADSAMEICSARLLLLQTAWKIDQGDDPREHISMVKVLAAETLGRVADRAVQIFGGMGYCKDLAIERHYRDARIYRIFDGTSEIHRGVIARAMLKGETNLHDVAG